MTSAVNFAQVSKCYKHFALQDVSFELPVGSIMGFIGQNGAGKSTTLRLLMGLVHQDSGQIEVLGQPVPARGEQARWEIGFVSEDLRLYKSRTIGWHLDFLRGIYPHWDDAYAGHLLRRFDLKASYGVKGLSHGQRVKAALTLALGRRPRLLVLDEPTTGLDPVARSEILNELMQVMNDEERTVLFSSQNTQDVEQISDLVTFIHQGRILHSGDREAFTSAWRRVQLEVPHPEVLLRLPGLVGNGSGGRLRSLTTESYGPAFEAACAQVGATIRNVQYLSLEEIFVATVQHRQAAGGQA